MSCDPAERRPRAPARDRAPHRRARAGRAPPVSLIVLLEDESRRSPRGTRACERFTCSRPARPPSSCSTSPPVSPRTRIRGSARRSPTSLRPTEDTGSLSSPATRTRRFPPNTPAAELKPLVRYFTLPGPRTAGLHTGFPPTPGPRHSAPGRRISSGLDLARRLALDSEQFTGPESLLDLGPLR